MLTPFDSWQYYEPKDLTAKTFPVDAIGHKKAVAKLAYRFAQAVVNSYRGVHVEMSADPTDEFYETYLNFLKVQNKEPEVMEPIIRQPAIKLAHTEALDPRNFILFYCGLLVNALAPIEEFENHINRFRAYYLGLLEKQGNLEGSVGTNKKQKQRISQEKLKVADTLETCRLWIQPLLNAQVDAYGMLKLCMISQIGRLLATVMAYDDKGINDLSFAICFHNVVVSLNNFRYLSQGNRLVTEMISQTLARKISIEVRASHPVIDSFCRASLEDAESELVAEQRILVEINKYNQWYGYTLNSPCSDIPIAVVAKNIRCAIAATLSATLPQLAEETDRATYTKLSNLLLNWYEFFSKEEPLTVYLMRELLTNIQSLAPYDYAANPMQRELITVIFNQVSHFYRLFDNKINQLFPVNRVSPPRIEALLQLLNEIAMMASANGIEIPEQFVTLRASITARLINIERIIPVRSPAVVIESAHDFYPKLFSEFAREENARRKREKELAQLARAKKAEQEAAKQWERSLARPREETAAVSSVLSPDELAIEKLFKAAEKKSNCFSLRDSITLMERAYYNATGIRKERAFLRLLHYRLQDMYNYYSHQIALPMRRNQVHAPFVIPVDINALTTAEEDALIAQQERAKNIAATHCYFDEIITEVLGIQEWLESEQQEIQDQQISAHIRYIHHNLLDFIARASEDCQDCDFFLLESGKYYKTYAQSKRKQPATNTGYSNFAIFHGVVERFASIPALSNASDSEERDVSAQRFWQSEHDSDGLGIQRYTKPDGSIVIQITGHYDLYQLCKSLRGSSHGKKIYVVGDTVVRILKHDVLLPASELIIQTELTEQEVRANLSVYLPYSIPHVDNLIRIESTINADSHDIQTGLNNNLEEEAATRDFTRSAVYLELMAIDDELGCVELVVHDPTGDGVVDIENNVLRCVRGNFYTTVTTPEAVRRMLKDLLQNNVVVDPKNREFISSGQWLRVFMSDSAVAKRQLGILYRQMLQEVGQATHALAEDQYVQAARAELAWLISPEALDEIAPQNLAEQIEGLIRRRILHVMCDQGMLPRHVLEDETLLGAEHFPDALAETLQRVLLLEKAQQDTKWDPTWFAASSSSSPVTVQAHVRAAAPQ